MHRALAHHQIQLPAQKATDLTEQEGVTCLAPDIVEAILDGRQPKGLRLAEVLGNGPMAWQEQLRTFGICSP
jgi:hypothetical protein